MGLLQLLADDAKHLRKKCLNTRMQSFFFDRTAGTNMLNKAMGAGVFVCFWWTCFRDIESRNRATWIDLAEVQAASEVEFADEAIHQYVEKM